MHDVVVKTLAVVALGVIGWFRLRSLLNRGRTWPHDATQAAAPPSLQPWQLWLLAAGGVLHLMNNHPFDRLGLEVGPIPNPLWVNSIARSWGIHGPGDVEPTLTSLARCEMHSAEFDAILIDLRANNGAHLSQLRAQGGSEEFNARLNFLLSIAGTAHPGAIAAWDLCRACNVARFAYLAGYIDEQTAWRWMARAGRELQRRYSSAQEMVPAYVLGRKYWNGGRDDVDVDGAARRLLGPWSEWRNLPWTLPLPPEGAI